MRGAEAVEARRRDPGIRAALAELGGWLPLMVFYWATRRHREPSDRSRVDWLHLPRGVPTPGTVPDRVVQEALREHGHTITRQAVAAARKRHGWPTWQPQKAPDDGAEENER